MHTEPASNQPYTGIRLIELLQQQHETRSLQSDKFQGMFKQDTFTLLWRAKVGSFPHPDLETIVSAGEPCGALNARQCLPRTKDKIGQYLKEMPVLPLNGYIPGSAIRGVVRAWAKKRGELRTELERLLGNQQGDTISPGKIEFLDAWPQEATQLTIDIVNPQQNFQVYHEEQGNPQPLYTLGNGDQAIPITVAIRGIPGKATERDVDKVWGWVKQALALYGVGGRTASGYGTVEAPESLEPELDPNYAVKEFSFNLYSQGSAGPDRYEMELRPSHWRGWLRSWILRFFLGVMKKDDAEATVGELMGTLGDSESEEGSRKGCIRLQMYKDPLVWGKPSKQEDEPVYYTWKGRLRVIAPSDTLKDIILPIIRIAVMVGGVGRGWRRPLHIFQMKKKDRQTNRERYEPAARGTYLTLEIKDSIESEYQLFGLPLKAETWEKVYQKWKTKVQNRWSDRFAPGNNPENEVFSPVTCAVYVVPYPQKEPLNRNNFTWKETEPQLTRGGGVNLIYQPLYKRKRDLGGDAAGGGNAHCSWVSIKRINIPSKETKTSCQEIVCLFMGGQTPQSNLLRSRFLGDLAKIPGAVHLFGAQPLAIE